MTTCWYKISEKDQISCKITQKVCTTCCCAHCEIAAKQIKDQDWGICF